LNINSRTEEIYLRNQQNVLNQLVLRYDTPDISDKIGCVRVTLALVDA